MIIVVSAVIAAPPTPRPPPYGPWRGNRYLDSIPAEVHGWIAVPPFQWVIRYQLTNKSSKRVLVLVQQYGTFGECQENAAITRGVFLDISGASQQSVGSIGLISQHCRLDGLVLDPGASIGVRSETVPAAMDGLSVLVCPDPRIHAEPVRGEASVGGLGMVADYATNETLDLSDCEWLVVPFVGPPDGVRVRRVE